MKKVVYSITKLGRFESKMSGVGYITDSDLIIAALSKNGKPYIRVFEDCIKTCHEVTNKPNEFKGSFYEIREVPLDTGKNNYDFREVEINYNIWLKIAD